MADETMSPAKGALLGGAISGAGSLLSGGLNLWNSRWMQSHADKRADTAWQRGVADMQRAGLNPAMMYGGGGLRPADSPMVNGGPVAGGDMFGGAAEGVHSAMKLRLEADRLKNETAMSAAGVAKAQADAEAAKANAARAIADTSRTTHLYPLEGLRLQSGIGLDNANRDLSYASARNVAADNEKRELYRRLYELGNRIADGLAPKAGPSAGSRILKTWEDNYRGGVQHLKDRVDVWRGRWKTMSDFFSGGQGNANGGASSAKDFDRRERAYDNAFTGRGR